MPNDTRQERTRSKVKQRRETQKLELRALILDTASREFLEHGYENFSLRRVAERIGYSATTIYLHFKSKDELLLVTVQNGFQSFDLAIESAFESAQTPLAQIEAIGRAYIEFGLRHPALYRLMFMQRSDFYLMPRLLGSGTPAPELQAPLPEGQHRVVAQELLVAAVTRGMENGQIRAGDALLLADALWASTHGLVSLAISPLMAPTHAQNVANQLLETLLSGLVIP